MIKRYNKRVFFPLQDKQSLIDIIQRLNIKAWGKISFHARERLKEKFNLDLLLLDYIKHIKLEYNDLFEYYKEGESITKLCFEFLYNGERLNIVLNNNKDLITIWKNNINDLHITLDKSLYNIE